MNLLTWLTSAMVLGAAPALPDTVWVKTPTRSFSWENLYALEDGKLWVKPNPARGAPGEWKLFEGTGVPFGSKATSFKSGDALTEFSTEGLMVVALSNRGRLYLWQPTLFGPTVWMDAVGQPLAGALEL